MVVKQNFSGSKKEGEITRPERASATDQAT